VTDGPYVYRTADPDVLKAWRDAFTAINAYVAETDAVLDAAGLGRYGYLRSNASFHPGKFAGLEIAAGGDLPSGWRLNTDGYAVPDRRYKAGRDIDAALKSVKHPGSPLWKLDGMPPGLLTGGGYITPAVRLLEDGAALYAVWQQDPERLGESFSRGKAEINHAKWVKVERLSDYYREVERAGAAKAAEATP
jgi:hypothetical protein